MENPERHIDLRDPPDGFDEVRLQRGDCIVSIWLPALAPGVAEAMLALANIGFDFFRVGNEHAETQSPETAG